VIDGIEENAQDANIGLHAKKLLPELHLPLKVSGVQNA
jgi:hypothetical protein